MLEPVFTSYVNIYVYFLNAYRLVHERKLSVALNRATFYDFMFLEHNRELKVSLLL